MSGVEEAAPNPRGRRNTRSTASVRSSTNCTDVSASFSIDASIKTQFMCPISLEVLRDPVIAVGSGMTYERDSIVTWFQREKDVRGDGHWKDPITNVPSSCWMLCNNLLVKQWCNWYWYNKTRSANAPEATLVQSFHAIGGTMQQLCTCPLDKKVFMDPVVLLGSGKTYSRHALIIRDQALAAPSSYGHKICSNLIIRGWCVSYWQALKQSSAVAACAAAGALDWISTVLEDLFVMRWALWMEMAAAVEFAYGLPGHHLPVSTPPGSTPSHGLLQITYCPRVPIERGYSASLHDVGSLVGSAASYKGKSVLIVRAWLSRSRCLRGPASARQIKEVLSFLVDIVWWEKGNRLSAGGADAASGLRWRCGICTYDNEFDCLECWACSDSNESRFVGMLTELRKLPPRMDCFGRGLKRKHPPLDKSDESALRGLAKLVAPRDLPNFAIVVEAFGNGNGKSSLLPDVSESTVPAISVRAGSARHGSARHGVRESGGTDSGGQDSGGRLPPVPDSGGPDSGEWDSCATGSGHRGIRRSTFSTWGNVFHVWNYKCSDCGGGLRHGFAGAGF